MPRKRLSAVTNAGLFQRLLRRPPRGVWVFLRPLKSC